MRRLLLLPFLSLLFAGCGGGGITIHEGEVTQREFNPAHNESYMVQQYVGETCEMNTTTHTEDCTPHYIWVTRERFVPDNWSLKIVNCHMRDKDGNTIVKKDGTAKCFKKWYDVDETTYHKYPKGKWYRDEKAGEATNA